MVEAWKVDHFEAGDLFGGHCELTDCLGKKTEQRMTYRLEGFKAQLHECHYWMIF